MSKPMEANDAAAIAEAIMSLGGRILSLKNAMHIETTDAAGLNDRAWKARDILYSLLESVRGHSEFAEQVQKAIDALDGEGIE